MPALSGEEYVIYLSILDYCYRINQHMTNHELANVSRPDLMSVYNNCKSDLIIKFMNGKGKLSSLSDRYDLYVTYSAKIWFDVDILRGTV